jgi:PAS domain S-box-containing protein
MSRFARSRWFSYVTATLAIVVATIASLILMRLSPGTGLLYAIYFGAVAYAAWFGGLGPGIFAVALSYLAANWFIILPRDQWVINGAVLAYFFVCLSIVAFSEAAKRALARAVANAQQTASILESMPDGYVAVDRQGRISYMNPVARELRTLHRTGGNQDPAWTEFPPTSGTIAKEKLRQAAARQCTVEFEHYYEPWKRWYEVKASPSSGGGLAIYFRDVTDRKRTEEEQRTLASIVDSSEDAIIGIDLDERIVSWNPGAEKLYGYTAAEAIGKPASTLTPPDQQDERLDKLAKIACEETTLHFDTVGLTKSGREVPVSLGVSPIKDASGRIVGASEIARDISDRKRAEEMLREADRRKDEFLAMLGHELRNPLAGIVNGVEVLKFFEHVQPDVADIHGLIERQANQMRRLIDDLLDVSRIARGKITLRTERFDLAALVRQIAQDHHARLRERELTLELDISTEPVWIDGDSARIAQVVGNLLDNAVKFTDKGGCITIRASASSRDRMATVVVRDTGVGLSEDVKTSMFMPFAQAEATLGRSTSGLGLGLALVKGLVELHGGTIEADSPGPGKGATFTIHLPLSETAAIVRTDEEAADGDSQSCRALIVEDNADVSWPIARLLELNGHQVEVAADGTKGIEIAKQFRPDIVFCDIGLPGDVDGYAVARSLRADAATRSAYLVAITGFGQEEDRRRAVEAGFGRHLTKPANHSELMALVAEVASARSRAG